MDKLISALVEAQKKISNANRTAMNDFFKSQKNRSGSPYATLEDVIQAVKEPLLEQGILYQQHSELVEGGVCIETILFFFPGFYGLIYGIYKHSPSFK